MYKTTIGLEIHVELKTKSKMFCSSKNDSLEKRANYNICPICTAQPGTLPVINQEAVNMVIKTGWALNSKIARESKFDRKNYFYPDLPKGYQISQYDKPFCEGGYLEIDGRKIELTRIHLEEDTGKLIHSGKNTLVDFNRAGVPLMEMVTEPDITSGKEARRFAEELRLIFRYLDISNADMEKGQMRIEVNISLSKTNKLGTKVEIKNLNSFRAVERSIDYEIKRQTEALDNKEEIVQETRGWDEVKGVTVSQREKEEAHDYRYFPEPDLPTLHFDDEFVNKLAAEIPELPEARRNRLMKEYGLDRQDVEMFVTNKDLGEYLEQVMSELRNWVKDLELKEKVGKKEFIRITKLAINYITTNLQGLLGGMSVEDKRFLITAENFAEFIALIYEGKISSKIAKIVLEEMFKTGIDPSQVVEEKSLTQMTDTGEIEGAVKDIILKNPKAVEDYRAGKGNALQFLVGQVMAVTRGRAKPDVVQDILKQLLQ